MGFVALVTVCVVPVVSHCSLARSLFLRLLRQSLEPRRKAFSPPFSRILERDGVDHASVELLVLLRRVVMPGAGARHQLDLFAVTFGHVSALRLNAFAARANVSQHLLDAVLVDDAHALVGDAQAYPALLGFQPETLALQVRQKTAAGLVVGVRNVVSGLRALPSDLTYLGHCYKSLIFQQVAHGL